MYVVLRKAKKYAPYGDLVGRMETESAGTRWRTGGEVRGKEANEVGSQQSSAWLETVHPVLLQSFSADPHSKKASTRLNWHPRRYKWARPFRWKTESGFCACAITFRFHSTQLFLQSPTRAPLQPIVFSYPTLHLPFAHRLVVGLSHSLWTDREFLIQVKGKMFALMNPLNTELNPICHLLALSGAQHILHVSRIRVNGARRHRDVYGGRRGRPSVSTYS